VHYRRRAAGGAAVGPASQQGIKNWVEARAKSR
jgi:hypothetical protein